MMEVKLFYFNPLRTCCYVVHNPDDAAKECAIIDPGCQTEREAARLKAYISQFGLTPRFILATHCHFDHIMGLNLVQDYWDIPCLIHPAEKENLQRAASCASFFDMEMPEVSLSRLQTIEREGLIAFGDTALRVLFTPGHSKGGISYYHPESDSLFSGDCLFQGSIGRTDLPGGDYDVLMNSIKFKLLTLPAQTTVYPGHGPLTTLAEERIHNPFLLS